MLRTSEFYRSLCERTWDMEFNPSKCQLLHIFRSRSLIKSEYYMHGQEIEPVDSAKYLGVNTGVDHSWNSSVKLLALPIEP